MRYKDKLSTAGLFGQLLQSFQQSQPFRDLHCLNLLKHNATFNNISHIIIGVDENVGLFDQNQPNMDETEVHALLSVC